MRAELIYWQKAKLKKTIILELKMYDVRDTKRYKDGIKYSLVCTDTRTGKTVLADNHHPKGPHIHINEREIPYHYSGTDKLIDDFRKLIFEHMGVKL